MKVLLMIYSSRKSLESVRMELYKFPDKTKKYNTIDSLTLDIPMTFSLNNLIINGMSYKEFKSFVNGVAGSDAVKFYNKMSLADCQVQQMFNSKLGVLSSCVSLDVASETVTFDLTYLLRDDLIKVIRFIKDNFISGSEYIAETYAINY